MGLAILAFVALFFLLGSAGLLLFHRAGVMQRLSTVVTPHSNEETFLDRFKLRNPKGSLSAVVQPFEKVVPKSTQEVSVTQKRLMRAGYRSDAAMRVFYGAKVLTPILLCVIVALTPLSDYAGFFVYVLVLGLGYLVPDFWVGNRIKARQLEIRLGLPELLDLLVVCIEAGLSLDQGLLRSSQELRHSQPEISDELGLLILEQRAGRSRSECWKNFAERADIDVVRALVSTVVQADQFGTSIAKTLRVYADGLRVARRQEVEEKAAKTTVKLVFPLVLFIFPSLFVVALGPAIIIMAENFDKYFK